MEKFLAADQLPHLLFYGPPGTGKTSTIMALAQRLYGKSFRNNVLEVRGLHCPQLTPAQRVGRPRHRRGPWADQGLCEHAQRVQVRIEASLLTQHKSRHVQARRARRGRCHDAGRPGRAPSRCAPHAPSLIPVIEQYTRNVRFCIICNYVNKIIPAIQSRCTRFRFSPLDAEQVARRIDYVIAEEHCRVEPAAREAILLLSKGDMRRALNILQACHAATDVIDEDSVYNCTGNPRPRDIETVFQAMLQQEFTTAYQSTCRSRADRSRPSPQDRKGYRADRSAFGHVRPRHAARASAACSRISA